MGKTFLGRLVLLLIASGLVLPSHAAEDTKADSLFSGPKHPLDKATYLRMRLQLLPILDGRRAWELDTAAGREEALKREIKVFPELGEGTGSLNATNQDHCFDTFDNLSATQQFQ